MLAFTYEHGAAVPCPYRGAEVRLAFPPPALRAFDAMRLTRRERRRAARKGTRGRRGARPVSRMRPVVLQPETIVRMLGHRLSDGRREAILYLPEGVEVTKEHLRAVERAITKSTAG